MGSGPIPAPSPGAPPTRATLSEDGLRGRAYPLTLSFRAWVKMCPSRCVLFSFIVQGPSRAHLDWALQASPHRCPPRVKCKVSGACAAPWCLPLLVRSLHQRQAEPSTAGALLPVPAGSERQPSAWADGRRSGRSVQSSRGVYSTARNQFPLELPRQHEEHLCVCQGPGRSA